MESLFLFAEANNITFIGGTAKTVAAAGGWVQVSNLIQAHSLEN
jgi:hypothetical protein